MKIYTSLFLTIVIFFGISTPVATSSSITPSVTKAQEIQRLQANNLVLLRFINYKTKYGSYEEYYKQTDSSLSEQ